MSLTLDEKYFIKAQNELRETEELKNQKLQEFRLWISKHDYFKESRQGNEDILIIAIHLIIFIIDDKFLLQFLRTKKFDTLRAFDLFEKYMLLKFSFPKWFDYNELEREKFWSLFDSGFITPLKERDEEGRRVIFVQAQKLDPKMYNFADILRLMTHIAQVNVLIKIILS